ncbi:protein-glutamate methylesterase/protein-glutamine glutaminase [Seleniivibrio woodruffii]|uniref:Protein-glutamate methylesterase/protein-glutamine glutaminase n=2 Tax=Seleniivibrio woodruffii TaxID=1078050 RepID=A0A4R1KF03_9BACT|nr:chemotaxis response regulator protein-glutamate methylesterase [Seleniivibrio woodruffii]TCK61869.1 two-component system chemotaxis response regulator CheB [Seleniivibrio woodruffii]TVZ35016.1 two-component system chemotaxis response regulator CheB [Seleniivibrio woodruffii]
MKKVRVLVVDDSALMRKKIKEMLDESFGIEVIDTARNGEDAIAKAEALKPDVITLDVNMPVMDGLTALRIIHEKKICPVIMLSSLTQEGANTTFQALELGAFDFVAKPSGTVSRDIETVKRELAIKVKAAAGMGLSKLTRRTDRAVIEKHMIEVPESSLSSADFKVVCIGISTGGPKTIFEVLPHIPQDINAAIFMVQHMPVGFTESYARRLNESCRITVKEAEAGDIVTPGVCYVGRAGNHMTMYKKMNGDVTLRLGKTPDHAFIPSVDIMMESASGVYGSKTLGVLMTGMGNDGAASMCLIKKAGGYTIAESEETAVVYGMPKEAVNRGCTDIVLPSYKIAAEICRKVGRGW